MTARGFDVAQSQHLGDRAEQQDAGRACVLTRGRDGEPERRLLVLADGMGGMACGRLAAETAVQRLPGHVVARWSPGRTRVERLVGAFGDTHRDVRAALAGANGGCALSACYVRGGAGGIACFAHAGDVLGALLRREGRGYRVAFRTTPHRFGRHVLSRCIGSQSDDFPDVTADLALDADDVLVLASDGVADAVDEAGMLRLARETGSAEGLADGLLAGALSAAAVGRDNATVMVARIGSGFLASRRG